jgi:hypothetical protein
MKRLGEHHAIVLPVGQTRASRDTDLSSSAGAVEQLEKQIPDVADRNQEWISDE